jgi:hypothetical protein
MNKDDDAIEWIDTQMEAARVHQGRDRISPADFGREFLRYDAATRGAHLLELERRIRATGFTSPEKAAKVHAIRRALTDAHKLATKVGR